MSMHSVNGGEAAKEEAGVAADRRRFLKVAGVPSPVLFFPLEPRRGRALRHRNPWNAAKE